MRVSAPLAATALIGAALVAGPVAPAEAAPAHHVLIISVDGMHRADLARYVAAHPGSAMARLVGSGTTFTDAQTTSPSDSFPGTVGMLTGGRPATTGVFYDDSFDHSLDPAGTTRCTGRAQGAEVDLTEDLDRDKNRLDAGQGLAGLPDSILSMTPDPRGLISSSALPVDPRTCRPVLPQDFLRVNTLFDVAHAAGLRTAWSDKHPAYTILDGHGPAPAIDDLFTPEINSVATTAGGKTKDWTQDNALTRRYDDYKVQAVLHEIDGQDHSGTRTVGEPSVFGMNFQSVSTAQKLATSDGLTGGYTADGVTPGPLVSGALDSVDHEIGRFVDELVARHEWSTTTVVLTAKHGQAPVDPQRLDRIDDGPVIDAVNANWRASHPGSPDLVAHAVDDDVLLFWLSDRSPAALDSVRRTLAGISGTGVGVRGSTPHYTDAGVARLLTGVQASRFFGAVPGDPRVPDVVGVVTPGVVYTSGTKLAEHGGFAPDDLDVPLVVASGSSRPALSTAPVSTRQIAPTTLRILGLNPGALDAVRIDGTAPLPIG